MKPADLYLYSAKTNVCILVLLKDPVLTSHLFVVDLPPLGLARLIEILVNRSTRYTKEKRLSI